MIKVDNNLTLEELEQASGGLIKIENVKVYTLGTDKSQYHTRTLYKVYDDNGKYMFPSETLEHALDQCEKLGYSTEIIDMRPGASQE